MPLRSTYTLFDESIDEDCDDVLYYVNKHRDMKCKNMELCLDVACILNWDGFSCSKCSGEGPDEILIGAVLDRISTAMSSGDLGRLYYAYDRLLFDEYFVPR